MLRHLVLIDVETVQVASVAPLAHCWVSVFVRPGHTAVSAELRFSIYEMESAAQLVRIEGSSGAVALHMAYYLGMHMRDSAPPPVHILSKDEGFDSLITHARFHGRCVERYESIEEMPLIRASAATSPAERLCVAQYWVRSTKGRRPADLHSLRRSLHGIFPEQSEDEVMAIVNQLNESGHLSRKGGTVTYPDQAVDKPLH